MQILCKLSKKARKPAEDSQVLEAQVKELVTSEENVILEWGSEHESKNSEDSQLNFNEEEKKDNDGDAGDEDEDNDHVSDSQDTDIEDAETEYDEDEIYKYKIQVHKDVDVEMKEAETVKCENKEKVEMTDATKADVEKTTKEKGDAELARNAMASNYQVKESTEFPLPSSSLSLSSGFGTHFLNLFFDVSLTVTPTILIVQQRTTPIPTPPITTKASTISITVPEFDALTAIQLRVAKLEKDVSELKKIDHSVEVLALLKSQVLTVLEYYLGSKIGDDLQKVLQRHTTDLIQKYSVKPLLESSNYSVSNNCPEQEYEKSALEIRKAKKELSEKKKMSKYTIKSTDKAALKDIERSENSMDKGVADTIKNYKRRHDDDDEDDNEDPPAGPNQGKKTRRRRTKESESSKKLSTTKETSKDNASLKSSKISKSATAKQPIEEPTDEVEMDDAVNTTAEDVVHDANQPHDDSTQAKDKAPMQDWFKQPPRPPTPDLELNKRQVVLDHLNNLGRPGHLTVAAEYFFNNDLEFLKSSDPEKKYTTSITKIKAARYEIVGIEEMTHTLWCTIKHAYDKDTKKGIKHWGERRKLWYRSQVNKFSKHNVYSTQNILGVKSVSVKKLHVYGHLEEIMVKRAD
ncbi:hypothetical protein Tco_1420907 [Tanacetum coccineum]